MPGRKYAAETLYRYGFNGKENDNEVDGEGGQQDYGMRIYDPRIGRFISVDPLSKRFAWYTPYQFAGNKPTFAIDIDGLEDCPYNRSSYFKKNEKGEVVLEILSEADWHKMEEQYQRAQMGYLIPKDNTPKYILPIFGFANATLSALGAASEMPAQFHYGNKIKPENKGHAFPMTGDGNLGRLFSEAVTAPALLVKEIIEDPSDMEKWGELGAMLFLGRMSKTKPVVAKYMRGRFIIGPKTLASVSEHLQRFGFRPENTIMLERMKKIASGKMKATEIDINFARHELREYEMMKNGGMTYEQAHEAVLKEQGMYHRGYEKKLYTEEALKAGNDYMDLEAQGKIQTKQPAKKN